MVDVVILELAVKTVGFPAMRSEVVGALASLADREYQNKAWLRQQFEVEGRFEDFDLVVHSLYDDTEVLPDPRPAVGAVLFDSEVAALQALGSVLTPVISRLGDSPTGEYLESKEWPAVVGAAGVALATMVRHGGFG